MSDVDRRFFEGLMQDKDLSLRGLASRMGMSHSQLSLTFSGDRKFQLSEVAQLSSIFGQPIERIIKAAGVEVPAIGVSRVDVIGAMQGDGTVILHSPGTIERASAPEGTPEGSIAVQARTAGSDMDWIDRTVLFIAKPNGVEPGILGRLCFCQIKDGPAVIAAVRRGYAENTFSLYGPFRTESVRLEFAAPVLFSRH